MTLDQHFQSRFSDLLAHLPAVREGNMDAIHAARVASRRLRAMLPLVAAVHRPGEDEWKDARRVVKRTAKALGKARDIDVAVALLTELEMRSPLTAPAAAAYRSTLLPQQTAARRQLIKHLETTEFTPVEQIAVPSSSFRRLTWSRTQHLDRYLTGALMELAQQARDAIEHASAVYFPRRTHTARVALKKLRYALELSTECEARRRGLKLLRNAQDALGQIHDRQVLLDGLERALRKGRHELPSVEALSRVLEAECRTLYSKCLARREDVLRLCNGIEQWSASSGAGRLSGSMVTMGVVALPSAAVLILVRRRRRAG
jgi:CHAD domain-containing protein